MNLVPLIILAAAPLSLMTGATVVYIALPTIETTLPGAAGLSGLVLAVYMLIFMISLPVGGWFSDQWGGREVFISGMVLFAVGSVGSALAPSLGWLLLARAVTGAGAAFGQAGAVSSIALMYEHEQRGRAYGIWMLAGGIAGVTGPLAAGYLLAVSGWRVLFLLAVPPVLAGVAGAVLAMPGRAEPRPPRSFDGGGLAALTVALGSLVAASQPVVYGSGWLPLVVAGMIGGFLALIVIEFRHPDPLVNPGLFTDINFLVSTLVELLVSVVVGGILLLLPFFIQRHLGIGPGWSGLAVSAMMTALMLTSVPAGAAADRLGPERPVIFGCVLLIIGLGGLVLMPATASWFTLVIWPAVLGSGTGCVATAVVKLSVTSMDRGQLGAATSVLWLSRRLGDLVGVSLAGAIVAAGGAGQFRVALAALLCSASLALLVAVVGTAGRRQEVT